MHFGGTNNIFADCNVLCYCVYDILVLQPRFSRTIVHKISLSVSKINLISLKNIYKKKKLTAGLV